MDGKNDSAFLRVFSLKTCHVGMLILNSTVILTSYITHRLVKISQYVSDTVLTFQRFSVTGMVLTLFHVMYMDSVDRQMNGRTDRKLETYITSC